MIKKENGITLIALVITIILLLILAGVTLNLVLNGGLIEKSQTAVDKYGEESARERLEIELINMRAEKITNNEYNQENFLTEKLKNAGFELDENNINIVIVDGWTFLIDRSVPKIISANGKVDINNNIDTEIKPEKNNDIKIELSQELSTNFTKSTVTIKITTNIDLSEININGAKATDFTNENGVYTIIRELTENITLDVLVKDIENGYNSNSILVSEITEDMMIRTAADLELFKNKVNEGRTFEGKTVKLANDIDLSTVCGENVNGKEISWEPIGKVKDTPFKGIFDGNDKKIYNLYINTTSAEQGFFSYIDNGEILNTTIESGSIKSTSNYIAGLAVYNLNGFIYNCKNNLNIEGTYGIAGICTENKGTIEKCINNGEIYCSSRETSHSLGAGIASHNNGAIKESCNLKKISGEWSSVGGITAMNYATGTINNCYNIAEISGGVLANATDVSKAAGIAAYNLAGGKVENCYNIGNIKCASVARKYPGGVVSDNKSGGIVKNCYSTQTVISLNSGTDTTTNCKQKDMSYFLLDKENTDSITYLLNNSSSTGVWNKVSTYNYPILSWQAN